MNLQTSLSPARKAVCSFMPFCETRVRWRLTVTRARKLYIDAAGDAAGASIDLALAVECL